MEDVLSKLDISALQKDPTGSFLNEIKTKVQKAPELLDTIYLNKKVTPMSSEPPELFGLVKVHKDDLPVRPVASFSKAPSCKLSKFLNTAFKELTHFSPKYSRTYRLPEKNLLHSKSPNFVTWPVSRPPRGQHFKQHPDATWAWFDSRDVTDIYFEKLPALRKNTKGVVRTGHRLDGTIVVSSLVNKCSRIFIIDFKSFLLGLKSRISTNIKM
ncbi:hypothetical protein WA026_003972 [Henosepilachna vigintioctopunctata]|uniref:Uncharacterized protein n=1 Tax=Henosepilachna vigintioctopunctata TaxID=420089 RepID=A0AAW1U909_9CUCU